MGTQRVPPAIMGIGPVPAIRKLMQVYGLNLSAIDVFEINEAFASQAAYCVRELGLDATKVNPNGGAIVLGHRLGATGAILTAKLLYELRRIDGRYAVVSVCIGGGMGAAALFGRRASHNERQGGDEQRQAAQPGWLVPGQPVAGGWTR